MRRHEPAIYPGRYVTCVHDHTKAVCTKARTGRAEGLPDHGECQPLRCANVALTPDNHTAWQQALASIDTRLANPLPPPPLVERDLRRRRAEIVEFLQRSEGHPR